MAETQGNEKPGRIDVQEGNERQPVKQAQGPIKEPVERLKETYGVPEAVYRGMAAMQGWKPGRMASAEEFLAARDRFLDGSAVGTMKKKRTV